ncbi:hypothetical protein HRbin04_00255 [archaeon HR04]|nr:hypothetical protein HRbin04_00255 [archaeon HR04]
MVEGMDSVKTNRTRRQRGYSFEYELVRRINSCNGWKAIRLGSPSVSLPDVIAVNNTRGIMLAIEAKSTSTDTIKVPIEQVARCINWLNLFTRYRHRYAILALKFMSKRWKKAYTYEHRVLQEYYYQLGLGDEEHRDDVVRRVMMKVQEEGKDDNDKNSSKKAYIACRYDGSLYIHLNEPHPNPATITDNGSEAGRRIRLDLNTFAMPWLEGKNR